MNLQNYQQKDARIREEFITVLRDDPDRFARPLDLSWSIWMFGVEPFEESIKRLVANGIRFVELKGDHFTADSGLGVDHIKEVLEQHGVSVSGACGMYTGDNDLSSNNAYVRQRALDYIRAEIEIVAALGGHYLIVVPSAVGRPVPVDSVEFQRSTETVRRCADEFAAAGIAAAVEPIRAAEVSLVHSVNEALRYIERVSHSGIAHINGDIYHMWVEEDHIGEAVIACGDRLVNLHLADSNRGALGSGMMDVDTVIMAAYLVGMNQPGRFLTPEPLGAIRDPYVRGTQPCNAAEMDALVQETVSYFRAREKAVRELIA